MIYFYDTVTRILQGIKCKPWIFLVLIYFGLLINHTYYLTKIYKLDTQKLEEKKKAKISGATADTIKRGIFRYAPEIAQGEIRNTENEMEEEILRRRLRFQRDLFNSLVSVITNLFKKG